MIDRTYIECACGSPDHTFSIWKDDECGQVFVSIHLTKHRWYERVWTAIKYIFNKSCKYGDFDEVILNLKQQSELKSALQGPIKSADGNVVYFDVDDTLVLWTVPAGQEETALRIYDEQGGVVLCLPHEQHIKAIKEHAVRGHQVVVWSQGGSDWAEKVVDALNLRKYVSFIMAKPSWFYDDIPASMFMTESIRYWRNPIKHTKVIQVHNDYGNNS